MSQSPPKVASTAALIRGLGPQADTFTLSGDECPGLCTLTACNAAQDWDIRKGYGLSWATLVPSGEQLSKVEFEVKLWTSNDSALFDAFAAKYLARPVPAQPGTTQPKSFGFNHDQASAPPYNVSSVVVLDVTYLGQVEDGMVAHRISLLEWKQPLPAPARPSQTTPSTDTGMPAATDAIGSETNAAVEDHKALEAQNAGLSF